jgi:hypothetical protein
MAVLDQDDERERTELDTCLAEHESASVKAVLAGGGQRHQRSMKRAIFAAARRGDEMLPSMDPALAKTEQSCRFAVGLTDIAIRDAIWLAVDQGKLDGRALWQHLLRRMPTPYDAAPLFLFGWASWRDGNGVLAAEAAIRALASDATYTAAELLLSAVHNGLDPHRTPRLRAPRAGGLG